MRVCILNEFFYPDMVGGTGFVLSQLARRLHDDHGFEVHAVTSKNSYRSGQIEVADFEDWDGVQIHRVEVESVDRARTVQRFLANYRFSCLVAKRLAALPRFDAVLVSSAPPFLPLAALNAKRRTGTPYLYIVYDLEPDRAVTLRVAKPGSLPVRLLGAWQRRWLHNAATVVAIGRCMKDLLVERYALPPDRVAVVEVGADTDEVKPLSRDTQFRREHGLEGFILLYSGNFGRYHDFDAVLDAAATLKHRNVPATIVLVGNGVKEADIKARVEREALTNVRVFPFVSHDAFPDLLASADMSLVTLEEGMEGLCMPSKFYSILASGRATLAMVSPVTEIARVVAETDCGVVVGTADATGLAHEVERAIAEPERVVRQGENARKAIEAEYSNRRVAEKFADRFRDAARGDGPR